MNLRWKHKKTGNVYRLVSRGIDATNERDGLVVAIYQKEGEVKHYVRRWGEFVEKFEAIPNLYHDWLYFERAPAAECQSCKKVSWANPLPPGPCSGSVPSIEDVVCIHGTTYKDCRKGCPPWRYVP